MSELILYLGILILGVLIASFSQILLKKSAMQEHDSFIKQYLNVRVISAYALLLGSTMLSVVALRVVPLIYSPIAEALGQVFVLVLSYIILKENIGRKKLIGIGVIIVGIFVMMI